VPVTDGRERRRHDDPLHTGVTGSLPDTKCPIASRDDDLVVVLWHGGRERGGDVQHMADAAHGIRPAIIR
jgi:hypothetical protein